MSFNLNGAKRSSFVTAASLALLMALSGCAPGTNEILPDDANDEMVGGAPDREMDEKPIVDEDGPGDDTSSADQVTPDASILDKYSHLDPKRLIPRNLLSTALAYFDANSSKVKNKRYLSVIDMSQSSTQRRFWIVDMSSGSVFATPVAHGKGSDSNHDGYAEKFSNVSGSNATSLGIYVTAETYSGSNGYSLRLDGKSSTNSRARSRAVVVHGASYVQDREVVQGRSWGCPAVPSAYRTKVIDWIKGGSVLYIGQSAK